MGDEADYQLEMAELDMLMFGDHDHEFPYHMGPQYVTKEQMAELARQHQREGNIHEQAMRGLTLEQVIKRSKRIDHT